MLYIHRFSIFDNKDASNEDVSSQQSYNKLWVETFYRKRHSYRLRGRRSLTNMSWEVPSNLPRRGRGLSRRGRCRNGANVLWPL